MSRFPFDGFLDAVIATRRSGVYVPHMVPVVVNGTPYNQNAGNMQPPASDITVEDYVLGLFALCLTGTPPIATTNGWVATRESFDELPSRWADRARDLHRAFGPNRTREVADYLRETNIGADLANVEDAEDIERFATPRQATIAYALMLAMRNGNPGRAELVERARIAEPRAREDEIEAAAHAAIDVLAAMSVEDGPAVRSEGAR